MIKNQTAALLPHKSYSFHYNHVNHFNNNIPDTSNIQTITIKSVIYKLIVIFFELIRYSYHMNIIFLYKAAQFYGFAAYIYSDPKNHPKQKRNLNTMSSTNYSFPSNNKKSYGKRKIIRCNVYHISRKPSAL